MTERKKILTNFSEEQKNKAMKKYELIEPYINNIEKLSAISNKSGVPLRSLYRWIEQYNKSGLIGLIRIPRSDEGVVHVNTDIKKLIEQLRINNKKMSIAMIHRKVINEFKEENVSYYQVHKIINNMEASLLSLAHKGSKNYDDAYDFVHIREANRANEIWQADHTLLDIEILDEKNIVNRLWLTIILDDFSRSVVGYNLSFNAPSAIQTSLTLHQAI